MLTAPADHRSTPHGPARDVRPQVLVPGEPWRADLTYIYVRTAQIDIAARHS
jgi:hypothetical protein